MLKKYRNVKIIVALVLLFFCFVVSGLINTETKIEKQIFTINKGDGFMKITDSLYSQKLIQDKRVFIIYSFLTGDYQDLKPGDYLLSGSLNIKDILSILKSSSGIFVTIPEGYNIFQIENELIEKGVLKTHGELVDFKISDYLKQFPNKYDFLKGVNSENNFEGMLYPESYYFLKDTKTIDVIDMFLEEFDKNIIKTYISKDGKYIDFYSKLIEASILEKEIYNKNEIPMALSVIKNRINKNMPLQIDATICYVRFMRQFDGQKELNCGVLVDGDKFVDSLYNTYKYKGLTPGPICNINQETFKQVLTDVKSDYFYYISMPNTNQTVFAKTLKEHEKNIQKYLKN